MKTVQRGFTLIELVVVIVILGILAAVAMPKFIDFKSEAATASAAGVAGGLSSASAINYAGLMAGKLSSAVTPNTLKGVSCATTATIGSLLTTGWPAGFTASGTGCDGAAASGSTADCTITSTSGGTAATAALTCY